MVCPRCENTGLLIAYKNSVEIDYCPECNGIWLDQGELRKIVQQSIEQFSSYKKGANDIQLDKTSSAENLSNFLNEFFKV
jgi:Zn-finger nucleic acid-binding protein